MKKYGLVGYPLGHSFSMRYFNSKFEKEKIVEAEFCNYALENINMLPDIIKENPELKGLCITIPYKEDVIKSLDMLDKAAEKIGAVNCIEFIDGKLKGFNTDVEGFEISLKPMLRKHDSTTLKALVFGTGGASKAVKYSLDRQGIKYSSVSRKANGDILSYEQITPEIIAEHKLLINCTPLGTFPSNDTFIDIPYDAITSDHILFDLVYNPSETKFLYKGRVKGAMVQNGYRMLLEQAEINWIIWNR